MLAADRVRGAGHPMTPDPHPEGSMGRPQVLDQSLPGLVMQLFQRGRRDGDGTILSPGFEPAGLLAENAEHDLAHGFGVLRFAPPSLGQAAPAMGAMGYGEPFHRGR
jgi:hypothetical protein